MFFLIYPRLVAWLEINVPEKLKDLGHPKPPRGAAAHCETWHVALSKSGTAMMVWKRL